MNRNEEISTFVEGLSDREVADVLDVQMKRIRSKAHSDARAYADLLAATLRVAGLREEAMTVDSLLTRLRNLA